MLDGFVHPILNSLARGMIIETNVLLDRLEQNFFHISETGRPYTSCWANVWWSPKREWQVTYTITPKSTYKNHAGNLETLAKRIGAAELHPPPISQSSSCAAGDPPFLAGQVFGGYEKDSRKPGTSGRKRT